MQQPAHTFADDSQQRYGYINQTPDQQQQQQQQQQATYAAAPQSQPNTYRYENDGASPSNNYQPVLSPPLAGGEQQQYYHDDAADVNVFEQPTGAAWDGADGAAPPPAEPPAAHAGGFPDDGGAAYATRRPLYLMYALSAWGDRMWEFAAVVFIISLYPCERAADSEPARKRALRCLCSRASFLAASLQLLFSTPLCSV